MDGAKPILNLKDYSSEATDFFLRKGIFKKQSIYSMMAERLGSQTLYQLLSKDFLLNASEKELNDIIRDFFGEDYRIETYSEFGKFIKSLDRQGNWKPEQVIDKWFISCGFVERVFVEDFHCSRNFDKALESVSDYLNDFFDFQIDDSLINEMFTDLKIPKLNYWPEIGNKEIHNLAWNQEYRHSSARERLLFHLIEQENRVSSANCRWPCVAIIQSSGYGKSRLVKEMLCKENWMENDPIKRNVIYWNFGKPGTNGFPDGNRHAFLPSTLKSRDAVTDVFKAQIIEEIQNHDEGSGCWFVLDEVSKLLSVGSSDGISFNRCLRSAGFWVSKNISNKFLFIATDTSSNIANISPHMKADPSFRPEEEEKDILDPFVLVETFDKFIPETGLLSISIENLMNSNAIFRCGRPIWGAYLEAGYDLSNLIYFARQKITCSRNPNECSDPTSMIACLAAQVTLQISPTSIYASELLEAHMATCIKISKSRESIMISYPSEPILAIAASIQMEIDSFRFSAFEALNCALSYGTVSKGHRGEVLAQIILIRAFQKARMNSSLSPTEFQPISLKEFFEIFSRNSASIPEEFFTSFYSYPKILSEKSGRSVAEKLSLMREYSSAYEIEDESAKEPIDIVKGSIFLTHFIYLSSAGGAEITHDLLRYCFRRSAGIVLESGRSGIDMIIPVHINDDKFIGLLIQAKNRLKDSLHSIVRLDNPETHYKFRFSYIFSQNEQNSFLDAEVSIDNWPGLFLALGIDEPGAALSLRSKKRTRNTQIVDPTVLVLTGMNYAFLKDRDLEQLKAFRDFESHVPEYVRESLPVTYGMYN